MSIPTKQKVDLGQLRAREAELAKKVEETRDRLSEYSTLIAEARREAVYAGKARPGSELGGPVRKLTDKEKADATALIGLEGDLSAVRTVIAEEAARLAEEETREAREKLELLHEQESRIWGDAGRLLGELATVWNAYTELAEQESRLAQENGLGGATALSIAPAPQSFKAWLLLLHRVATDAEVRAEPITEQLIDSGVFGNRDSDGNALPGAFYDVRPAGTRQVDLRKKLDYGDRLIHVVPDLRNVVRALALSGHVPTITGE
jgi:hypothetical protein